MLEFARYNDTQPYRVDEVREGVFDIRRFNSKRRIPADSLVSVAHPGREQVGPSERV